jgi:hypothetical protein
MKQTSPGGAGRKLPGKLPHADLAELPLPVGRFCGVFKLGPTLENRVPCQSASSMWSLPGTRLMTSGSLQV